MASPIGFVKKVASEFLEDECMSSAAAIAYYSIFSLPPLLVIILTVATPVAEMFVGPGRVEQAIIDQLAPAVGQEGAEQIHTMIENSRKTGAGPVASTIGILVILFGATSVLAQLQFALNKAWEVQPDPKQGGVKNFMAKRVLSLGMILAVAFLLLVSMVLTAVLSAMGNYITSVLPIGMSDTLLRSINETVTLIIATVLFAAMFKVLPDAEIRWKHVWVGAAFTAVLFVLGKYLIGLYVGRSDVNTTYGFAGSLVLILVWIYYSSVILLLGAEFTQVWARRSGDPIEPSQGAVRIEREVRRVESGSETAGTRTTSART